jgi:4,5-dihydroxyphthalate decarboxylase
MSLYKAFCQAKNIITNGYSATGASQITLPWLADQVERAKKIMGEDWWPYGLDANRKTLETFLRYHREQGLSTRRMTPEELFAPETLDEFKI